MSDLRGRRKAFQVGERKRGGASDEAVDSKAPVREAAGSDQGRQAMLYAAKSLAMTTIDLLAQPENLERVREVFQEDVKKSSRR